ncbi:MAG: hypothetical protein J3K34DRAFT_239087 [Monoraphidium minutum]|nr:MAG: hypothetical protein J3K34DRAFT_239087 [Monoraphidium minutum]
MRGPGDRHAAARSTLQHAWSPPLPPQHLSPCRIRLLMDMISPHALVAKALTSWAAALAPACDKSVCCPSPHAAGSKQGGCDMRQGWSDPGTARRGFGACAGRQCLGSQGSNGSMIKKGGARAPGKSGPQLTWHQLGGQQRNFLAGRAEAMRGGGGGRACGRGGVSRQPGTPCSREGPGEEPME